ncbi:MAG: non-canonical purine NTP pyrophosphatase, partial [Oscillospiraceae bacterium]
MKFVLASQNQNKLRELREILEKMDIEVVSEADVGVDLEVEETGTTFEENSALKA